MPKKTPEALVMSATTSEIKTQKLAAELSSLKRKYKDALNTAAKLESKLDFLEKLPPPAQRILSRHKKRKPANVAVIVPASDWHVEERVALRSTNGKNQFNLAEAERRITQFYQKVLLLLDWQQHLAPVSELWHPLLGDLMSGYIHDELVETNELSPTEAVVFLQEMIAAGIDLWKREAKLPILIPTCVGNHGRTTQRMRVKTSAQNSYEWLLYATLARFYRKDPKVHWFVGEGYHNIQEIVGRRVRFHHGDGLRYSGGIGGITIPVNKAIAQWNKVGAVDLDVFGHYHTFLTNYPTWVSCGSLMGFTEYSLSIKADFQHPTQAFIVVDRNYGMVYSAPIFLTKSAREAK